MRLFIGKAFVLPVKQEFERSHDLDIIEKLLYICAVNSVFYYFRITSYRFLKIVSGLRN
jgi:hypothetical protein